MRVCFAPEILAPALIALSWPNNVQNFEKTQTVYGEKQGNATTECALEKGCTCKRMNRTKQTKEGKAAERSGEERRGRADAKEKRKEEERGEKRNAGVKVQQRAKPLEKERECAKTRERRERDRERNGTV
jgi:hypothetical protein